MTYEMSDQQITDIADVLQVLARAINDKIISREKVTNFLTLRTENFDFNEVFEASLYVVSREKKK